MRKGAVVLMAVCVVVAMQTSARADGDYPTKWSQLPNMETGIDYASMTDWAIAADDFLCENPLPVTDVHWWGSYYPIGDDPQPINGFTIRFFSDIVLDFSQPDVLLYEVYIPGSADETFYGHSPYDDTNVYQYYVDLPEPFEQELGTVYWLSIQVDNGWDTPPYWGWHNSLDLWNDDAVQAYDPGWEWWELYHPEGWSESLAFELTVGEPDIPEPTTLVMLALAGAGLALRKRLVG